MQHRNDFTFAKTVKTRLSVKQEKKNSFSWSFRGNNSKLGLGIIPSGYWIFIFSELVEKCNYCRPVRRLMLQSYNAACFHFTSAHTSSATLQSMMTTYTMGPWSLANIFSLLVRAWEFSGSDSSVFHLSSQQAWINIFHHAYFLLFLHALLCEKRILRQVIAGQNSWSAQRWFHLGIKLIFCRPVVSLLKWRACCLSWSMCWRSKHLWLWNLITLQCTAYKEINCFSSAFSYFPFIFLFFFFPPHRFFLVFYSDGQLLKFPIKLIFFIRWNFHNYQNHQNYLSKTTFAWLLECYAGLNQKDGSQCSIP